MTRTEPQKTKRPGEVSKERWRTVLEKARKPQRLPGPTSARETTTLFTSVSQVSREVRNEQFLGWPTQMKSDPATRDNTRYCEFHRDYGHCTDDCIQLKKEIKYLIRRGYLRRFIAPENQPQNQAQNQAPAQQPPPPPRQATTQHQQPLGEIHVISGGFAGGGESSSARKAHLRSIRSTEVVEVQAVSKLPRLDTSITFSDSDLEGCQHPHDDPLVIRAVVANKTVHRVLVDNRSSADIIFASAFDKMGIGRERMEPVSTYLRGFFGEKVLPLGSIQLVLTLGDPPCQATTTTRFLVVDAPSAYNMLLGKPSLNAIKAIPSAYHMMIKFPTVSGVGMVRGDQRVARECYLASMKQKAVDNIYLDELDMRNEVLTRPEPSEELEPVSLDDDPEHLAYIGSKLAEDLKSPLIMDATASHELLSFMDAFSGYNQISMDPNDQEKTSFVTTHGTYCYRVMPFGLKNAGATYQRLVNRMFQKQIGTTMEVYIDDMLVKSPTAKLHIAHLSEAFQILREYNMKLNPAKCTFGVSAKKFLSFQQPRN